MDDAKAPLAARATAAQALLDRGCGRLSRPPHAPRHNHPVLPGAFWVAMSGAVSDGRRGLQALTPQNRPRITATEPSIVGARGQGSPEFSHQKAGVVRWDWLEIAAPIRGHPCA